MRFNITAIATAAMALLVAQAAAQSNDQECCASMYYILPGTWDVSFPALSREKPASSYYKYVDTDNPV